jgi:FkbM family methyltransferase
MKFYSQHGEERILEECFKGLKNGTLIEVGSADPEELSNSRFLIENYSWSGILIEPNPVFFDKIENFYKNTPNIICLNKLIHNTAGTFDFYYLKNGFGSTMHEWFKNKINEDFILTQQDAVTLESVIDLHIKNNSVDFLSIDVEGNDLNVIQSIGSKLSFIDLICVESSFSLIEYENLLKSTHDFYAKTGGNFFFKKK